MYPILRLKLSKYCDIDARLNLVQRKKVNEHSTKTYWPYFYTLSVD